MNLVVVETNVYLETVTNRLYFCKVTYNFSGSRMQ